jgi:hypothetical protein
MEHINSSLNRQPVLSGIKVTVLGAIAALFLVLTPQYSWGQVAGILPQQRVAIRTLANQNGFNEAQLTSYLNQKTGRSLNNMTSKQAAEVIREFQSNIPPQPGTVAVAAKPRPAAKVTKPAPIAKPEPQVKAEPILASILEVGMSKRFHLVDGNIISGTIMSIKDDICQIETIDGLLHVPSNVIMEETADIQKKDNTRYVGPVLRDGPEEIVIRSIYGDVVISKRDIRDMDRYYGGTKVPWAEDKQRFHQGEASLTDIFQDPTAFPLAANTFYISGLSIGYAFTDRFMVRSKFGSDLLGDLNMHPVFQFYHRQTGSSEVAAAFGFHMFNHHPARAVGAKYANHIIDTTGAEEIPIIDLDNINSSDAVIDANRFYWETYVVLSSRRSLASGRGKMGWHLGLRTNSLALDRLPLETGYKWEDGFIPFRAWGAFEYDLSKRLKLEMEVWADNGHKFRSISDSFDDYIMDDTPFVFDNSGGDYRPVDFDFGLLYAVRETFRIGLHFQEPFLVFYWEFFEL